MITKRRVSAKRKPTISNHDIVGIAEQVRALLQRQGCTPTQATEACVQVLAGFALDDANDNVFRAAATVRRVSEARADQIERGVFAASGRQ